MNRYLSKLAIGTSLALACQASFGAIYTYGFNEINNTNYSNIDSQLKFTLEEDGTTGAIFKFFNTGTIASSITDIYFDFNSKTDPDTNPFNTLTLSSSSGVSFSEGAQPANLPGGNGMDPEFTAAWSTDSEAPITANGINADINGTEWLQVSTTFNVGSTFKSLLNSLIPNTDKNFRVGLHVQSINDYNGGSLAFVNGKGTCLGLDCPPSSDDDNGTKAPVPAAIWLFGSGIAGLIGLGRRNTKIGA